MVFGVANRRSVAYAVGKVLESAGTRVLYAVRDQSIRDSVTKRLGGAPVYTCNLGEDADIAELAATLERDCPEGIDGFVHSVAFARYSTGMGRFSETERADFLEAVDISCYSLVRLTNALRGLLNRDGAIVTMSISSTQMAAENYGYMAPVKAALDSTVVFLANELSAENRVRVNAVGAGLLKTSSSAGIPGYVDSYLYAEKVIPRQEALRTEEVANTVAFLLSPRASGINAQTVVVDAGMSVNYFDRGIIRQVVGGADENAGAGSGKLNTKGP